MNKKIIVIIFSLLLIAGLAGTFWGPSIAGVASGVWNSCQRGKVNCAYPGDCHSYLDTNNDAICDRSQSNPQSNLDSATTASSTYLDSSTDTAVEGGTGSTTNTDQGTLIDTATSAGTGNATSINNNKHSYHFIPILAATVVLYGLTWILSVRKIITSKLHRKLWNVILLCSTAVSALLGLFLILSIDFDINISLPFSMLFWHVEVGIVSGIVALFHIIWHWRYFITILKAPNKVQNQN